MYISISLRYDEDRIYILMFCLILFVVYLDIQETAIDPLLLPSIVSSHLAINRNITRTTTSLSGMYCFLPFGRSSLLIKLALPILSFFYTNFKCS